MSSRFSTLSLLAVAVAGLVALASPGPAAAQAITASAILEAEAARAEHPDQLVLLRRAVRHAPPRVQLLAIRALGRLERPELVGDLLPLLSGASAAVRAEAANAVAQAVGQDSESSDRARSGLIERLKIEKDADVRAAVCEALGRLPVSSPDDARTVERTLVAETTVVSPGRMNEVVTRGALRGLESLLRLRKKLFSPSPETVAQLQRLAVAAGARERRLAFLALNGAAAADAATVDRGLADADVEVRRLAAASPIAAAEQLRGALADRSPVVRYEALRAYGRRYRAQHGCAPLLAAATDSSSHVALLALDLLATPCQAGDGVEQRLFDVAAQPFETPGPLETSPAVGRPRRSATRRMSPASWHRQAHALVSLAALAPERARALLGRFESSQLWPVRMYAARAAAALGDTAALVRFAEDSNANVCEAAITGLVASRKHEGDQAYIRALGADDPQLVMTAARALEGTPGKDAAQRALVSALQRWTAGGSDTSRDPRMAILDRLHELGSRDTATPLAPLLHDFDRRVAERAAEVMTALTGEKVTPAPARRPPQAVPSPRELARLSRSIVRVRMATGGTFDVRLLADLAPLSCTRFARLVAAHYYDGLTFHRVVSNFLIQGGSPGANEYAGYHRFMLDETGRASQVRGTLGTSTRGRDTGDAQIYVNVVDNPRLDHDYTIFGEVVRGMSVVDAVQEADTIERIVLVPSKRR